MDLDISQIVKNEEELETNEVATAPEAEDVVIPASEVASLVVEQVSDTETELIVPPVETEADKKAKEEQVKQIQKDLINNAQSEAPVTNNNTNKEAVDPDDIVSVYDFVNAHINKINNCQNMTLTLEKVPEDKYILFRTNADVADLILFENSDTIYLKSFVPDVVQVYHSGIYAYNQTQKAFITSTCTIQMDIADAIPSKIYKYKRCRKDVEHLVCEVTNREIKYSELDQIKLRVRTICPKLYPVIKEIGEKGAIKKEIVDFVEDVVDLAYLIKLNKDLLMEIDV